VRLALLVALAALLGCTSAALATQARIADGIARTVNTAEPVLVRTYDAEGLAAIGAAPDHAAAIAATEAVRAHWRPLWGTCYARSAPTGCEPGAWEALRTAHETYATALEQVRDGAAPLSAALALVGPLVRLACVVIAYLPEADRPTGIPCAPSVGGGR